MARALSVPLKTVLKQTGGHYPAPLRILEVLAEHLGGSVEASLAAEARAGAELLVSPVCKNLVHLFHMREAARKRKSFGDREATGRPVRVLGVLGAGVMGGGIGHLAASNDIRVYLKDINHDAVSDGLQHARSIFVKDGSPRACACAPVCWEAPRGHGPPLPRLA